MNLHWTSPIPAESDPDPIFDLFDGVKSFVPHLVAFDSALTSGIDSELKPSMSIEDHAILDECKYHMKEALRETQALEQKLLELYSKRTEKLDTERMQCVAVAKQFDADLAKRMVTLTIPAKCTQQEAREEFAKFAERCFAEKGLTNCLKAAAAIRDRDAAAILRPFKALFRQFEEPQEWPSPVNEHIHNNNNSQNPKVHHVVQEAVIEDRSPLPPKRNQQDHEESSQLSQLQTERSDSSGSIEDMVRSPTSDDLNMAGHNCGRVGVI